MNSISGRYLVCIKSGNYEKLINLLKNADIVLTNLSMEGDHFKLIIDEDKLEKLKAICDKQNVGYAVLKEMGVTLLLKRILKRKVFITCTILSLLFLYYSSLLLWNIKITDNDYIKRSEVLDVLEKCGVTSFVFKNSIVTDKITSEIYKTFGNVSFVSVDLKGSTLYVSIEDYKKKEKETEGLPYSDIFAIKDAEIFTVITAKGTPTVKKGIVVKAGDLLVRGEVVVNETTRQQSKAVGKVIGKCVYYLTYEEELEKEIRELTENEHTEYEIEFNRFSFKVFKYKNLFENYEKRKEIFNFFNLIRVNQYTYQEYTKSREEVGVEEAKIKAKELITKNIMMRTKKIEKIINSKVNYVVKDKKIYVSGVIITLEDIGIVRGRS